MKIESKAFSAGESIPTRYTCQGENINPPLQFSGVPDKTKSLVLIMDDPDAPAGDWIHWVIWNIPGNTSAIDENTVPSDAREGKNSWGKSAYSGPCPPSGSHRYFFKIYALDTILSLPGADAGQLRKNMKGHVLAAGELMGTYQKS